MSQFIVITTIITTTTIITVPYHSSGGLVNSPPPWWSVFDPRPRHAVEKVAMGQFPPSTSVSYSNYNSTNFSINNHSIIDAL
jgi:hypothetical protein